jgi:hypothetical protein
MGLLILNDSDILKYFIFFLILDPNIKDTIKVKIKKATVIKFILGYIFDQPNRYNINAPRNETVYI